LSSLLRSCGPITGTTCVLVMLVLVFKEVNIEAGRFVVTLFHSQLQWSKRSAWGQYQTILKRNKQYSQVTPSNTNNTNNTKQQHPRCQKSQQKSYLYWQMPPSSVHWRRSNSRYNVTNTFVSNACMRRYVTGTRGVRMVVLIVWIVWIVWIVFDKNIKRIGAVGSNNKTTTTIWTMNNE
jgi:hypothetical protein